MTKNKQSDTPELSLVIPIYRSQSSIGALLQRLASLDVEAPWEVIFIDDGSPDQSHALLLDGLENTHLHAKVIQHTRNFGEHQAVLSGYRLARGRYIVNLDDDLQNPPEEALRLWRWAKTHDLDVVYGDYRDKKHASWRNLGSRFANATAHLLLDLPGRFYLSSFRCVRQPIAAAAAQYRGPYPYIDGLLSQLTQSIDSLSVQHDNRYIGESGYNLQRLVRLWLNILTSFSIMPLRLASVLGFLIALTGLIGMLAVVIDTVTSGTTVMGWPSLFSAILFFGGLQALLIGIAGEYLGRVLLTVSRRPQSHIRSLQQFRIVDE